MIYPLGVGANKSLKIISKEFFTQSLKQTAILQITSQFYCLYNFCQINLTVQGIRFKKQRTQNNKQKNKTPTFYPFFFLVTFRPSPKGRCDKKEKFLAPSSFHPLNTLRLLGASLLDTIPPSLESLGASHSNIPIFQYPKIPLFHHSNIPSPRYAKTTRGIAFHHSTIPNSATI